MVEWFDRKCLIWRFASITILKIDMEKIYTTDSKNCKLVKTQPQTIKFLLNYSKSIKFIEVNGLNFESNLN
ncbi:hypothetical protein DHD32_22275 [Arenibacter sp. TNZ]|nr:hypothetical protein [Arenibacter sp. TNZ]